MTEATEFDSIRDLRDNARSILAMPAYKRWKEIIDEQINTRQRLAIAKMATPEEAMERNYQNGEAAGMMAAVDMWRLLEQMLSDEITKLQEEHKNDSES